MDKTAKACEIVTENGTAKRNRQKKVKSNRFKVNLTLMKTNEFRKRVSVY